MTFKPGAKLDPSQVRDLRADTRSEAAGIRRAGGKSPSTPKVNAVIRKAMSGKQRDDYVLPTDPMFRTGLRGRPALRRRPS